VTRWKVNVKGAGKGAFIAPISSEWTKVNWTGLDRSRPSWVEMRWDETRWDEWCERWSSLPVQVFARRSLRPWHGGWWRRPTSTAVTVVHWRCPTDSSTGRHTRRRPLTAASWTDELHTATSRINDIIQASSTLTACTVEHLQIMAEFFWWLIRKTFL